MLKHSERKRKKIEKFIESREPNNRLNKEVKTANKIK